jgi:hypothetical protein
MPDADSAEAARCVLWFAAGERAAGCQNALADSPRARRSTRCRSAGVHTLSCPLAPTHLGVSIPPIHISKLGIADAFSFLRDRYSPLPLWEGCRSPASAATGCTKNPPQKASERGPRPTMAAGSGAVSLAPNFLRLAHDCRRRGVFHLDPAVRTAGAVRRAKALGHDALTT